jgi:3-oxoacyl-[acyl-carrier protein] reductase
MRFQGKRALVTGASRGIGRSIAVLLASEGASVAIHYRGDASGAEETATACAMAGGSVPAVVRGDLGAWEDGDRVVNEAASALGGLDIFIANAGLSAADAWSAPLDGITQEMWDAVLDTDLRGSFTSARAAGRIMRERGGAIVLVGSTPALTGADEGIAYGIAKAGVLATGRFLATVLAPSVRVNAVALGSIATRWLDWLDAPGREAYLRHIPLGRFGRPEDAARAILFLASDDAAFVTGQTVIVDGGAVMM